MNHVEREKKPRGNLQKTQTQHDSNCNLLVPRDVQFNDQSDGEQICQEIGKYVGGCIRKVESIDVDTGFVDD